MPDTQLGTLEISLEESQRINEIDEEIRAWAGMNYSTTASQYERARIQQERGSAAIDPIVQAVKDDLLDPYWGTVFLKGIEDEYSVLYSASKQIAQLPQTYGNSDGTAITNCLELMCAFAASEDEFAKDAEEIRNTVLENVSDQSIVDNTIFQIRGLESGYSYHKFRIHRSIREERRNSAQTYFDFRDDDYKEDTSPLSLKIGESIPKDTIRNILSGSQKDKDMVERTALYALHVPISKEVACAFAERFYAVVSGEESVEHFPLSESELAFVAAVLTELKKIPSDIDKRIIKSQLSALHALIFSGGLDVMYRKYREERIRQGQEFPDKGLTELDVKASLAYSFLETVKNKNQEMEHLAIPSGLVTVGVEVEYQEFVSSTMPVVPIYEELIASLKSLADSATTLTEREVFLKAIAKYERVVNIYYATLADKPTYFVEEALEKWEPGVSGAVSMEIIATREEISPTKEIVSKPSASYKTQIRELVAAAMLGGMFSPWGVHETFGGIKLSPSHTEIMNALPIVTAAGFLDFEKLDSDSKDVINGGYGIFFEKHPKPCITDNRLLYFPFHKTRLFDYLEKVSGQKQKHGVELRSLPGFKLDSFGKLVRQLSFHYFFAHGVKSVQKPENERISQDMDLIEAYNELQEGWKELIDSKGLQIPPEESMFMRHNEAENREKLERNPYLVFLSKMVLLSQEDKEFRLKVRGLIKNYSKSVKSILGVR